MMRAGKLQLAEDIDLIRRALGYLQAHDQE